MENNIKRYQEYQLQWMLDNGYSLADLMDVLKVSVNEALELEPSLSIDKAIQEGFDCLDSVNGFGGELWAGYNEWLNNEAGDGVVVRPFKKGDEDDILRLDELSGNNMKSIIDDLTNDSSDNDFSWGIFKDDKCIGYCTIGYLDEADEVIEGDWSYQEAAEKGEDCYILSTVFIEPKYEGHGYGTRLIKQAINGRFDSEKPAPVYIDLLDPELQLFYEKSDFVALDDYTMVFRVYEF